jgi:hypothetical protein
VDLSCAALFAIYHCCRRFINRALIEGADARIPDAFLGKNLETPLLEVPRAVGG